MRENLILGIEEMAITLRNTVTNVTIELPFDLHWSDEFSWSPVQQVKTWTTTGAMLVETSTKQAGRPVTLDGSANAGYFRRADILLLQEWAFDPNLIMQLHIRGANRTVIFDHEKGGLEGFRRDEIKDSALNDNAIYYFTIHLTEL